MNGQTATTSNGAPLVNGATHSPSKKHKRPQSSALPSTSASAGGSPNIPATGLFKSDTIHDIADSLSITNLNDTIASSLASDLEYRLHQIIDEASRFTRHSRRSTVTTGDIDQALKVLNVEPLYGHSPLNNPAWRRALPGSGGPVYFLQDEEVDFEKVLKVDKVPLPRGVRYTAHWLAIEGIQPLVPENPTPSKLTSSSDEKSQPGMPNGIYLPSPPNSQTTGPSRPSQQRLNEPSQPQPRASAHLSKELQLYYKRLTEVLPPSSASATLKEKEREKEEKKRTAALSSLRGDSGLQGLVPYLVRWVGEGVRGTLLKESGREGDEEDGEGERDEEEDGERRRRNTDEEGDEDVDRERLEMFLDVIDAMLDNKTMFIEPFLHQVLASLLSILLTSILSSSAAPSLPLSLSSNPSPSYLRSHAASLLGKLLRLHAPTYPSLPPRLTKALLSALIDPEKMLGTREGALRGLCAVGKEAVKRGVVGIRGIKVVGEEVGRAREMGMETGTAEQAVMTALQLLQPRPSTITSQQVPPATPHPGPSSTTLQPPSLPLNSFDPSDIQTLEKLKDVLGEYFAMKVAEDAAWARAFFVGGEFESGTEESGGS